MVAKYPMTFSIETPDGAGEARKDKANEPWKVSYPTGGLRWYGSVPEVQAEIRKRLRLDYGRAASVTFTKGSE